MKPGTTFLYEGGAQRGEMTVTHDTRKVMGVECVVVDHKEWEGDMLIERTYSTFTVGGLLDNSRHARNNLGRLGR
jgi:hypothetical protein